MSTRQAPEVVKGIYREYLDRVKELEKFDSTFDDRHALATLVAAEHIAKRLDRLGDILGPSHQSTLLGSR